MKLSVYKNGQRLNEIDLGAIVQAHSASASIEFSIGRSADSHVVLDDPQVSRVHAKVIYTSGLWRLVKQARLGTLTVNGNAIDDVALKNGDAIAIGPFSMNVTLKEITTSTLLNTTDSTLPEIQTSSTQLAARSQEPTRATTEIMPPSDESVTPDDTVAISDAIETVAEGLEETQAVGMSTAASDEADPFSEEGVPATESAETFDTSLDADAVSPVETPVDDNGGLSLTETQEMDAPVDDGAGERTSIVQSFATFELRLTGQYAPYDRYVLMDEVTSIGRSAEKCQIVLNDSEVSSVHATIRKTPLGYLLEDQNSSNGTLLNGERINKIELKEGDEFIIGYTTFSVEVKSELISAEQDALMPVDANQEVTVEEVVEEHVDFGADGFHDAPVGADGQPVPQGKKSLYAKFKAMPPKRQIILVAIAFIAIWLLFPGEEEKKPDPKATQQKGKTDGVAKKGEEKKEGTPTPSTGKPKKQLSKDQMELLEQAYTLAKAHAMNGKFREALDAVNQAKELDPDYKGIQTIEAQVKEGLAKLEELERKAREEMERRKRAEEVKALVDKAKAAVKDRHIELAESLFSEIFKKDPENIEVPQLKMELDAWKKEQERIALEKAQKEAERKRMVEDFNAAKEPYTKSEWYKSIARLEEFLRKSKMDDDLIQEATKLLQESKKNLEAQVSPLIGKARSLKEGQDLKGAYEVYNDILKLNPAFTEALNEMDEIRETLEKRAKKIYREALVSESLSLFEDAKEKFQEVQQISPSDSEYYKKATEKLKSYWD